MKGDFHVRFCERLAGEIPACLLDRNVKCNKMRRANSFLIAAMVLTTLGCGGVKDIDGIITMTTSANNISFWLKGSGTATVDWGDGSEKKTVKIVFTNDDELPPRISRRYSDKTPRTITITGKNITGLVCTNNQLNALNVSQNTALTYLNCWNNLITELDVSQNTALDLLWCGQNQLTALDVSHNTVLTRLTCSKNQFTAVALNDLFITMHGNEIIEFDDELGAMTIVKWLYVDGNPGSADCNPSIAEEKGWWVFG